MKPTVIDLFCGMGGFSKGFEKAGFQILWGIDNWPAALETFQKNHKDAKGMLVDIVKLDDAFFEEYKNKVDVVIAGPPCQGFTVIGKRDVKDPRNSLFEEVVRVVKIIRPKMVVIENVVGLLSVKSPNGRMVRDLIIERLEENDYYTECRVLNSAYYGIPQSRKRVIFIGSRIGKIGFPEPNGKTVTVGEALKNIPVAGSATYLPPTNEYQKLMSNETGAIYNHEAPKHGPEIIERMSLVPPGGNWRDIPKEHYNVGGEHSNNYRRLDPKKPAITIKHVTKSMIIHPWYDRCLTVREAARLQSFYDDFIIYGTRFDQHQQLANAVPPLMAYEIAKHIMSKMNSINSKSSAQKKLGHFGVKVKREAGDKSSQSYHKFTFIDLFSGIGGFRIALERVGGVCVFSCDTDKWANETYFLNFGEWPKGDITKIDPSEIPDYDVLCAGFPCQPFSIAGRRLGFADTRGTLFFDIEKILRDKKPKAFILENVKGLINHDKGNTFATIKNSLMKLGYHIFYRVLNAKDYGLPQNRDRIFIVGFRKHVNFEFPLPIELRKNILDILDKDVKGYEVSEIALRHIKKHYEKFIENNRNESKFPTLATEIRPSRCVMKNDGISPCLTAKMGTGGNNIPVIVEEGRRLTVKECLRLMGFPENFKIKEDVMQSYKQVGNSVPIPIVELLAREMVKHLE